MKTLCILACVLGILSPTASGAICKPDLGLVVDTTRSLEDRNVPLLREALADLVGKFDISEETTHVSLETFDRRAIVHNRFNDPTFWSVPALIDLINENVNNLRSPTRLDRALQAANSIMFTAANGDRPEEDNVLVVFTDGRTQGSTNFAVIQSAIRSLTEVKGTQVIAVAIGPDSRRPESQRVLNLIAPGNVISVDNFQSLAATIDEIFKKICLSICRPDLGLVVDTTRSIRERNVPVLREALIDLVQKFDISEDTTHVSLETFNRRPTIHNSFNDSDFWSVPAVVGLINSTIDRLRSPTFLARALQAANDIMFTEAYGDRPGFMNTLVVFTDGRTNPLTNFTILDSAVEGLEDKGTQVIAVAIGPDSTRLESRRVLTRVAGANVIRVDNFQSLADAIHDVVYLICGITTDHDTHVPQ